MSASPLSSHSGGRSGSPGAMTMTSPLTQLLHDTKPLHKSFIDARDYESAKHLREKCFHDAAEVKKSLRLDIMQRHATERRRLERARELALREAKEDVVAELGRIDKKWADKEHSHALRQAQRFELFERQVRSREETKPVVLSAYVRDLQRSERRLADFHVYDEATMVLNKIKDREVYERQKVAEAKDARIAKALDLKRQQREDEEASRRAMTKNALLLATFRAAQEQERVAKQYDHVERDMEHALSLELRVDPLLKGYERPYFIKPPPNTLPDGSLKTDASHRGSEYLRRMQGSKYAVPSLCEMYSEQPPSPPTIRFAEAVLLASGLPLPNGSSGVAASSSSSPPQSNSSSPRRLPQLVTAKSTA